MKCRDIRPFLRLCLFVRVQGIGLKAQQEIAYEVQCFDPSSSLLRRLPFLLALRWSADRLFVFGESTVETSQVGGRSVGGMFWLGESFVVGNIQCCKQDEDGDFVDSRLRDLVL